MKSTRQISPKLFFFQNSFSYSSYFMLFRMRLKKFVRFWKEFIKITQSGREPTSSTCESFNQWAECVSSFKYYFQNLQFSTHRSRPYFIRFTPKGFFLPQNCKWYCIFNFTFHMFFANTLKHNWFVFPYLISSYLLKSFISFPGFCFVLANTLGFSIPKKKKKMLFKKGEQFYFFL